MGYYQKKKIGSTTTEVGNLTLDLQFSGIGRIKKSAKTKSFDTFAVYKKCLNDIYQSGNHEPLFALKANKVSVPELYTWWKNKGSVPPWGDKSSITDLITAVEEWLDNSDLEKTTKRGYKNCFKQLVKGERNPTLADLPRLMESYRTKCRNAGTIKTFNQTRAAVMALLRDTTKGRTHHLYIKIHNIRTLPVKLIRRKEHKPFSPSELANAFKKKNVDERLRDAVWCLVLTGCRPKEFLKDGLRVDKSRQLIEIYGKKTATAVREVPLIYDNLEYQPYCQYKLLRSSFKKVFPNRELYDCRRTFKTWLIRAGVDELHQLHYCGHKFSVSQNYGRETIDKWIKEDRVKLWDYIRENLAGSSRTTEIVTEGLEIPPTPYEEVDLTNTKLRDYWYKKLDEVLEGWYRDGIMRRLYRVKELEYVKTY